MLNTEQQTHFNEIVKILESNKAEGNFDFEPILVTGKAGSGKSYLISMLVKYFQDNPLSKKGIQCTALTHKALNEFRKKTLAVGVNEDYINGVSTVHSYFQIKPLINTKTGKEEFTVQKFKRTRPCSLLIIDEVSMLDEELWKLIKKERSLYDAIILCGDEFQIPAINDNEYNLFQDPNIKKFKLNNIVRQAQDNPIIQLASEIVEKIENKNYKDRSFCIRKIEEYSKLHDEIMFVKDSQEFIQRYFDFVKPDIGKPIFDSNFYNSFITTFTNKAVDSYNYIAKSIFKQSNKINYIDKGDLLILQSPAFDPYIDDLMILNNNAEFLVHDLNETTYEGIDIYELHNEDVMIRVIKPESKYLFEQKAQKLADKAKVNGKLWKLFYDFKKKFVEVKQCFSCSTHKSQGSTVTNVYVDLKDMPWSYDVDLAFRLTYVAITRCTDKCICKN